MRVMSLNINGLRAKKDRNVFEFINGEEIDILCLQNTRVKKKPTYDISDFNYKKCLNLNNHEKMAVYYEEGYDVKEEEVIGKKVREYYTGGLIQRLNFGKFTLINIHCPYNPESRYDFKRNKFLKNTLNHVSRIRAEADRIIVCANLQVAHENIDFNGKPNDCEYGCNERDRKVITNFINKGFIDCFRECNTKLEDYTYTFKTENTKNEWRFNYIFISNDFSDVEKDSLKCKIITDKSLSHDKEKELNQYNKAVVIEIEI